MLNLESSKYEIVTSVCKTDGAEGATVYGVKITNNGRQYLFEDISVKKRHVEDLLVLLKEGKVAPNQVLYIIEDYIALL